MAFAVVGVCVLVLFYGVTYRTTRAAYCAWWCVSLGLFLSSAVLFLLNGTVAQVIANPLGNAVAVAGANGVWAAARSLHGRTLSRGVLLLAPGIVLAASLLDDPRHDIWTGGPFFLVGMAVSLGLSARELRGVQRDRERDGVEAAQFRFAVASLTIMSGLVAAFYLLRAIAFVAVGPDDAAFRVPFGSQATTLLTMALLVVVTFSMAGVSHYQQTTELRAKATTDGLTGLLNRSEFLRMAEDAFAAPTTSPRASIVVADLDDFKSLNDGHGHAAGDRALIDFAGSCQRSVSPGDLVGRLGGDEFVLLLRGRREAEEVVEQIGRLYEATGSEAQPVPTVSFGIACLDLVAGVKETILRADVALYQAKAAGRDRVKRYDARAGHD